MRRCIQMRGAPSRRAKRSPALQQRKPKLFLRSVWQPVTRGGRFEELLSHAFFSPEQGARSDSRNRFFFLLGPENIRVGCKSLCGAMHEICQLYATGGNTAKVCAEKHSVSDRSMQKCMDRRARSETNDWLVHTRCEGSAGGAGGFE